MQSQPNSVIVHAISSLKWSFFSGIAPRLITPITTFLLAGLLTPADFGTVAVSTLIVSLAQILTELGLATTVIQRQSNVMQAASIAFWLNVSVACVLYLTLWVTAPTIERLYDIASLAEVVRVSSLSLIIFALGAIPVALLTREMRFQQLFWMTSLPQIISALLSLVWAFLGGGVWALVIGPLAGQVTKTALVWLFVGWVPTIEFNLVILREILRFSIWVSASGIQTWLFLQADNAIAGLYLGAEGLGIYSLAFNFSMLLPTLINSSVSNIAYPTFCNLASETVSIGPYLLKLQSLVAAIVFPIGFGLAAVGGTVFPLLYDDRWNGIGNVMMFLAIAPGLTTLWSLSADPYRAINRPDVWTKVAGLVLITLLPALFLAGPHGLNAYTAARSAGALMLPVIMIPTTARILDISIRAQLDAIRVPLLAGLVMFTQVKLALVVLSPQASIMGWFQLLLVIIMGAVTYIGLVVMFDHERARSLRQMARRVAFSAKEA